LGNKNLHSKPPYLPVFINYMNFPWSTPQYDQFRWGLIAFALISAVLLGSSSTQATNLGTAGRSLWNDPELIFTKYTPVS
jgi:hypothetical protein